MCYSLLFLLSHDLDHPTLEGIADQHIGSGISIAVIPVTARRLLGASPGAAGARDRSADPSAFAGRTD